MTDLKLFEMWAKQRGHYVVLEALARFRTFQTTPEFTGWIATTEEKKDATNNAHSG